MKGNKIPTSKKKCYMISKFQGTIKGKYIHMFHV